MVILLGSTLPWNTAVFCVHWTKTRKVGSPAAQLAVSVLIPSNGDTHVAVRPSPSQGPS